MKFIFNVFCLGLIQTKMNLSERKIIIGELKTKKEKVVDFPKFKKILKEVAIKWFERITTAKLNLAFVSKVFIDQCEFLELVKGIINNNLKGWRNGRTLWSKRDTVVG